MGTYRRGKIWWISYTGPGGESVRESTGTTIGAVAERMLKDRRAEVAMGTWRPRSVGGAGRPTVASFAPRFVEELRRRGVRTAGDYEARLRDHVIPALGARPLDAIRPRDVAAFIQGIASGGKLAPRSVVHVLDALRSLLRLAVFEELIIANPASDLPRGIVPKKRDADPSWRATAIYTATELAMLLTDARVPGDRRVMYALEGLAGLRFGEAAGRRWIDLVPDAPMARLVVATQYDGRATKTDTPRAVPVHPMLAAILAEWRLSGWRELVGRAPKPEDLIAPSRRGVVRSVRHGHNKLHDDLDRLGLRRRRQHDLRRTFVSLARAGGASPEVVRLVTHGRASADPDHQVIDGYTTLPWAVLCDAVSRIEVPRLALHNPLHSVGGAGSSVPAKQAVSERGGRDLKPRRGRRDA